MKIYLAGPEVFLPNALEVGAAKKALCEKYGCEGLFPMDNVIPKGQGLTPRGIAQKIYEGDVAQMDRSDATIANITPLRGPHADDGTAFEIGYGVAQGKRVFVYDNDGGTVREKMAARGILAEGGKADLDGLAVEDFGHIANLMLTCGAEASGGGVVSDRKRAADDLTLFEECLKRLTGR